MDCACGEVAALAGTKRARLTVRSQIHLTFENDVGGFGGVSVSGIEGVRAILPDEHG